MAHENIGSRTPGFAPNMYYIFNNDILHGNSLTAGSYKDSDGNVSMRPEPLSSQNWQLYFQQERYFIRNYDYGGDYQLGLIEDSVIPRLIKRSGVLAQQWILERQADGTYKIRNGFLGNNTVLAFTVAPNNVQPAMQSAQTGSTWSLVANPSALAPKDPSMMQDNKDFEVEKLVSSSTSSSTPTSTAWTSQPSGIGSTGLPSASSLNNGGAPTTKSPPLAPGAIAGVAIGATIALALITLLCCFLWVHRKPKRTQPPSVGLSAQKTHYAQAGHVHLNYGAPVQLHNETARYEMENFPTRERPTGSALI